MNTRLLVYRVSKSVQRPDLYRSVEKLCVQRKKEKKLSGNFGYMGRSNTCGDLDQMWRVGRYRGHNHVCNIWWLSVKVCGCSESPIDLRCRPYNTGHTTVWPCETVKLKFLNRVLVLTNAYKCAKFQLPSSISCGDMEGSKIKIGAADGYQCTKFQLSRSISFWDMRGVPK